MKRVSIQIRAVLLAGVLGALCSSCLSHKDIVLLNGDEVVSEKMLSDTTMGVAKPNVYKPYKIQAFDQLLIKINAFDGSTEEFLNREFSATGGGGNQRNFDPASVYFRSYSVNDSGYIYLPILEEVKVAGKTAIELKEMLDKAYNPYLKFASTNIKLANQRITVLGEVQEPGIHYLYNEQNSLLEAIGLAGDITEFGDRRKVKLIRQTEEGAKTVYLNMNRSDFLDTEYYYVHPHDMIYVEPKKTKAFDSSAKAVGVVISGVSLAALFASLIIDFTRPR